jgi:diacylglycerol kinase (ATP)
MGFLLSAEILNTVMEELMDHFFKEYSETARIVKDLSAGYVLVAALTCLCVFLLTVGVKALGL